MKNEDGARAKEDGARAAQARDLNEAFPYKVCINLERRPERWKRMRDCFKRHDIQAVRRFAAVDGNDVSVPDAWSLSRGAYGCLRSHLGIVLEARQRNLSSVLIFEDDVDFAPQLQQRFRSSFRGVPDDWEMLFLGGLHMAEPTRISSHVFRVSRTSSTYAYALKRAVFDVFIETNSDALTTVDGNNLKLQKEHNCYCFLPHLAWVETLYSDAQERWANHWYLKESLVLQGSGVCRLLEQTALVIAHQGRTAGANRDLILLVEFYRTRFPGLSVQVIEGNAEPSVDSASLPHGCEYSFLKGDGAMDRGSCFNTGIELSSPDKNYFIFTDSSTVLEEWDIRANLRMCERYECTTGFSASADLNRSDSARFLVDPASFRRWLDVSKYPWRKLQGPFGPYCFFRSEAIRRLGGWRQEKAGILEPHRSIRQVRALRTFESPNLALRLLHE